MKKGALSQYVLISFALLFYSGSSLCIKLASNYPALSVPFVIYYGVSVLILMSYAVLWQLILKRVDLSKAYAMKPLTMILSMLWGVFLFQESITWNMIVGAVIILFGIRLAVAENGE